jgi:hypothetical protein
VRLLLDEMISPRVARELRARNHDVESVKKDRPELENRPDAEIVLTMAAERRAIVTNNIRDFAPLHTRLLAAGQDHYGLIFSYDATMPRNKASFGLWIETLETFLAARARDDALRNRIAHLR